MELINNSSVFAEDAARLAEMAEMMRPKPRLRWRRVAHDMWHVTRPDNYLWRVRAGQPPNEADILKFAREMI